MHVLKIELKTSLEVGNSWTVSGGILFSNFESNKPQIPFGLFCSLLLWLLIPPKSQNEQCDRLTETTAKTQIEQQSNNEKRKASARFGFWDKTDSILKTTMSIWKCWSANGNTHQTPEHAKKQQRAFFVQQSHCARHWIRANSGLTEGGWLRSHEKQERATTGNKKQRKAVKATKSNKSQTAHQVWFPFGLFYLLLFVLVFRTNKKPKRAMRCSNGNICKKPKRATKSQNEQPKPFACFGFWARTDFIS